MANKIRLNRDACEHFCEELYAQDGVEVSEWEVRETLEDCILNDEWWLMAEEYRRAMAHCRRSKLRS